MPKYGFRKCEVVRIKKGKDGMKVQRDILEQCADEQRRFSTEEYHVKIDEKSLQDTRTSDEIMLDAFDKLKSRSYQIRSNALRIICAQLQLTHSPDFLERHNDRMIKIIRNALTNKIPCEIDAVSVLLSLAAIQLPDSNRSIQVFYEPLIAALTDEYLRESTRFAALHAIGILTFLYEFDRTEIYRVLKRCQDIFGGRLKDSKDGRIYYELQMAAWTWAYLMSVLPIRPRYADKKPFFWPQVLQYVEEGMVTTLAHRELKVGGYLLSFDNWALRVRYEMLSNVIGSANVTKNLARNEKLLTKLYMAQSTECSLLRPGLKASDISSESTVHLSSEACPFSSTDNPQRYDPEKLSENLILATHKSSLARTKALDDICKDIHLAPRSVLADQENVILEIISKAMKRGTETEQLAAVRLVTLTVFQREREEPFRAEISNLFFNCLQHSSVSISTNALLCTALSFIELFDDESYDCAFHEPTMSLFRQIFLGSHKALREDGPQKPATILRAKALESWGLLLTKCSPEDVYALVRSKIIDELR